MFTLFRLKVWRTDIQAQRTGHGRTTWSDRIIKTGIRRSAVPAQTNPENNSTHDQIKIRPPFPAG